MPLALEWLAAMYVGKHYLEVDCWQLAIHVYRDLWGIEIDPLQPRSWRKISVGEGQLGDLIEFREEPTTGEKHVGIYLTPQDMVHSTHELGVVIERWNNPRWRSRVLHLWTYKDRGAALVPIR